MNKEQTEKAIKLLVIGRDAARDMLRAPSPDFFEDWSREVGDFLSEIEKAVAS